MSMSTQTEDRAPLTRSQKVAAVFLPAFLTMGMAQILRTGAWPGTAVLAFKAAMLIGLALIVGGIVWSRMGTECPDEREREIQLKSIRTAFLFLVVAVVSLAVFTGPHTPMAGDIAAGMGLLAVAVQSAATLIHARRGV